MTIRGGESSTTLRASAWSNGRKPARNISIFGCYKAPFRRPPTTTRETKKGGSVVGPISRRKLLSKGSQVVFGGVCIGCAQPANASAPAASAVDYYQKLGVTPFINAAGTYTILSASTMPDEAQAAIALAGKRPVHLVELHNARGAYRAKRLRCARALGD